MAFKTLRAETTAEAYLELLHDRGIEYFLGNAGTDFAPLVEAFARFEEEGRPAPRPLVIPHEFVAVSMAHGYYLGAGRPLAVMVHVTVGHGERVHRHHQRLPRERAHPDVGGPDAGDGGRSAGLARSAHPLGPGELRPGRDAPGVREVGLRAAQPGTARVGGGPGARDDARRPAGTGLPHLAARGARLADPGPHHHLALASSRAKRALPRPRAHRGSGAASSRTHRRRSILASAAGRDARDGGGAGRARRGGRHRRGRGRSDLRQLPARSPAPPRLQPVGHRRIPRWPRPTRCS